jgi:tetratricopeptide (TPR) repeat protein
MKTITLTYNNVSLKTTLLVDDKEIHLNCLGTGEGHRLDDWKDSFFPDLVKKCNFGQGSECVITFFGDKVSYDTIYNAMDAYLENKVGMIFTIAHGEEKMETTLKCRNCGFELKPHWPKCPKCKTMLNTGPKKCRYCGEELEDWMDECPACLKPVEQGSQSESAVESPVEQPQIESTEPKLERSDNMGVEDYKKRAQDCFENGDTDNAIVEFTFAIRIDPNTHELYFERAKVFEYKADIESSKQKQQNGYKRAIADYSQAIAINPDFAKAYQERGFIYAFSQPENKDKSIAEFSKAIQILKDSEDSNKEDDLAEAYFKRGQAYAHLEKPDRAISDFSKAIEFCDHKYYIFLNRGEAFVDTENYEAAVLDFTAAIKLYEDETEVDDETLAWYYYQRGNAYYGLDNEKNANADFKTAVRLDPSNETYRKNLGDDSM